MMRTFAEFDLAVAFLICFLATFLPTRGAAQTPNLDPKAPKPAVFA